MILSNCDAVRDVLPEALAGTLAPEAARALAAHLAGCADCRAEADVIRTLRRHPVAVPDGLEARVRRAAPVRSPGTRFPGARAGLLAAAAAGLLLGGGLLLRSRQSTGPGPGSAPPPVSALPGTPVPAAPAAGGVAALPADGRTLLQALPGTNELSVFSSTAALDDLSEDELRTLLKELQS